MGYKQSQTGAFMNYEKLSPNLILGMLEKRLTNLKVLLERAKRSVKTTPQGHLRISQKGNSIEYYHITTPKDSRGKYIPLSKENLARQLAQKDYEEKALKLIEEEIKATQRYLKQVCHNKVDKKKSTVENSNRKTITKLTELYSKMTPARQALITPFTLTDAQYAEVWQSVTWTGHPFSEETPVYTTARGERVRSKSEVLIADALTRHSIPYRYEYPLNLHSAEKAGSKTSLTFYPDFLCLNKRTRNELYWEHFGLMDSPEYANNATKKLRIYTENKIFPGSNLILTMETQTEPLTSHQLEQIIEGYLL